MKNKFLVIAALVVLLGGAAFASGIVALSKTEAATVNNQDPKKPTDLTAKVSGGNVTLSWLDNSGDESSFWIMRSLDNTGNNWKQVGTVSQYEHSFTDKTAGAGITYYYRVRANLKDGSAHSWSNMIDVKLPGGPVRAPGTGGQSPFYTPDHVVARENSTANLPGGPVVDITWKDQSYSNSGYVIERAKNNGSGKGYWSVVATVSKNEENWRDYNVSKGNQYAYRIRAVGTKSGKTLYSNYSAFASVTVK